MIFMDNLRVGGYGELLDMHKRGEIKKAE